MESVNGRHSEAFPLLVSEQGAPLQNIVRPTSSTSFLAAFSPAQGSCFLCNLPEDLCALRGQIRPPQILEGRDITLNF